MIRARHWGLRARATAAFGVMGFAVAVSMGAFTWFTARSYLLDQREDAAARRAYADARLARSALRAADADVGGFLSGLGGDDAIPVIRHRSDWYAGSLSLDQTALPPGLQRVVAEGGAGQQRFRGPDGQLHLGVGVALPAVDAAYFEIFPLVELQRTLGVLRASLIGGVIITSMAAAAAGRAAAARILRPLSAVTTTAKRIADGELAARLSGDTDRDLAPLTEAFNTMTGALQDRILTEARFASDVSHELRGPLAALSASTEIIQRRRSQLPDVVGAAFDMLKMRLATFEALVLDLLEISRFDNGVARLDPEPIHIDTFLTQLLTVHARNTQPSIDDDVPDVIVADRRRLAQALHNICANATAYADGITAVQVWTGEDGLVWLDFDDAGPGVAPSERLTVFERFSRGAAGQHRGGASGLGLGLALAAEHIKLHGGSIHVLDAPSGGARFRIGLPRDQ